MSTAQLGDLCPKPDNVGLLHVGVVGDKFSQLPSQHLRLGLVLHVNGLMTPRCRMLCAPLTPPA